MTALVRYTPALTGVVKCGRSDKKFSTEPMLSDRWCILDANHGGLHIAGKNLSFEREVERYDEETA